jgi:hypothetical protein
MSLDPTTGNVTGTPTVGGTFSFQLKVTDATGTSATSSGCTITVSSPPTTICGGDTATIGFWHNQNGQALINAVNGGGASTALSTWLVQQFPILFGPTSTYNVTGDTNAQVASTYLTVFSKDKTFAQIFAGALAAYVTNSGLAGGNFAVPYGFNYTAGGTAGKLWNVSASGSGIGLTNNTSYTLMQILLAANQAQSASPDSNAANVIFSAINQGGDIGTGGCGGMTPLAMNCATGSAIAGAPYSSAVTATGGVGSYTFTLLSGSLPPGLTLSSNGTISGTPTATGTYSYVVQVTDSQGNTAQTTGCSIKVYPAIAANCAGITAVQGAAIAPVTITAIGGSGTGYTFSANGLPSGLTMSANGTISGTPTVSGTFTYSVTIKDSAGNTGTLNCAVTVAAPISPLSLTCPSVTTGTVGTAYAAAATASGGVPPYTYSLYSGSLPTGLTLNPSTGAIMGIPTSSGTFSFTIKVSDASGLTAASSGCTISVSAAVPIAQGDTATIGFWHNQNGQALIQSLNGGSSSTALGNWLATNFPYLYGPQAGSANDMTNQNNAQVAAYDLSVFNNDKTGAQILGGAIASYVTNTILAGGTYAAGYGFNTSTSGTGSHVWSVGSSGSSIGLSNNQSYGIMQLLQQVNLSQQNGTYNSLSGTFNTLFSGINQTGDIQ